MMLFALALAIVTFLSLGHPLIGEEIEQTSSEIVQIVHNNAVLPDNIRFSPLYEEISISPVETEKKLLNKEVTKACSPVFLQGDRPPSTAMA